MLDRIGLMTEPCAAPEYVPFHFQFSIYPARRNFHISAMKCSSFTLFLIILIRVCWSILSKHPLMSPSINHFTPV